MTKQNKQDIINIRVSKDYKEKLKQKADASCMSLSKYIINCIDTNQTNIIHDGDILISEIYTLNSKLQELSINKELPVQELQNTLTIAISKLNNLVNERV